MGENLKKIRRERGMTQIALQMQTGIEQALISKYETGERIPPTETLIILADFLILILIFFWIGQITQINMKTSIDKISSMLVYLLY